MSRYGKTPIALPKGVELKVTGSQITVKGPKGELNLPLKAGVLINVGEDQVNVD